jgi:hypothetical protein
MKFLSMKSGNDMVFGVPAGGSLPAVLGAGGGVGAGGGAGGGGGGGAALSVTDSSSLARRTISFSNV